MPSTETGSRLGRAQAIDLAKQSKKLFYKIGNVCEITGTQPYILRFWESEFPQLAPQKSRSGQRLFRSRDIEIVQRIKQLLYEEGYTIAGARRRLEQEQADQFTEPGGSLANVAAAPLIADREAGARPSKPTNSKRRASVRANGEPRPQESRRALRKLRKELEALLRRLETR